MKFRFLFFPLFLLLICTASGFAQPTKKALEQLAQYNACFTDKEAVVASISGDDLADNSDTMRRLNESLPVLNELVECTDKALKIVGLPLKTRRELQAKRREYVAARDTFDAQACIFNHLDEAEKAIPDVKKKIEEPDKLGALVRVQLVRIPAIQAKLCAQQGLLSKTIPLGMKSGLKDNLLRIESLLKTIEDFKKTIESMPE